MKKLLLTIVLFSATTLFAKDYIVRLKDHVQPKYLTQLNGLSSVEVLVEELGIYKITIPDEAGPMFTQQILSDSSLKYSQEDHPVVLREVIPNDPQFKELWSLKNELNGSDIKATEAWGLGTHGKNLYGQDIVVAVVDGGVDVNHKDLKDNMWINKGEIPNNQVDDDRNGYVDDIYGWNAVSNTGYLPADGHATHVAGIVSARGDNGTQVVGVNWNVKIMSVNGASGNTSVVLRSYGYILKQKKLWLQTQGREGANVVVTNSSFGVDRADCSAGSYPAWNDIYEEMGRVGILSAAATANAAWDIDVTGDVPTGCTSDYIVSVTNTNNMDRKYSSAGWGKVSVDLGAPGTSILSTYPNQMTRVLTGTSMATPHVAGAVAFLHSVASPQLQSLIQSNPAQGALEIKRLILSSVDQIADLQGKTVSNGRLNLKNAAESAYRYSR